MPGQPGWKKRATRLALVAEVVRWELKYFTNTRRDIDEVASMLEDHIAQAMGAGWAERIDDLLDDTETRREARDVLRRFWPE